ncbi:hypothetical protein SUBVAR_07345 [Subdoligranulum variabile DSM 15176]|uniref:Uncharacterized protein n=1 Tax=Subdoligranulum variabile DSM 15176 TaxID=411471 RepID=D1PSG2_9FIRM|nr:hypothetical protein SUBVAR_07345 [Subdoligranulum variabile DSM 15176]
MSSSNSFEHIQSLPPRRRLFLLSKLHKIKIGFCTSRQMYDRVMKMHKIVLTS